MRRGRGEGTVFKDSRGLWTAVVELTKADNGDRRRKKVRSKDKRVVLAKLAELQQELKLRGDLPTNTLTVEQWFTYWLEQIAVHKVRPKTYAGYRSVVLNHVIPGLGAKTKLDKVTPATVRKVHKRITDLGLSPTYALNAHRVMSASFEIALREGRMSGNPAKLTDAPRKTVPKLDVLTLEESITLLQHIAALPDGARWAMALLTGARRGEVIGLEADRVGDTLDLSWQLQRLKKTATGEPIVPADFEYRQLTDGLFLTRPKSRAGWREIPLVEPLRSILNHHITTTPVNQWGLVFTDNNGNPRDPDRDSAAWSKLMREVFGAERTVRLHDLRHTAADLLYLAGVPEDLIIEVLGHSTRQMSRSYKSRGNQVRLRAAMEQVAALLAPSTRALDA